MANKIKRHRIIMKMLRIPVTIFGRLKFNFKGNPVKGLPEPFILISNHTTFYDMLFIGSRFRQYMYFVAGEHTMRKGIFSSMLEYAFAPISRSKAAASINTVFSMLKNIKSGNNVCLFAEGDCTYNGLTGKIPEATGKTIKKAGCSLITYRIYGGYFSNPRWAWSLRKGKMRGEVAGIYSPEQLDALSADEINKRIFKDIFVNAYEEQKKAPVKYRGKRLAEGIENILLLCPVCRNIGTIKSSGNAFSCPCGMHGWYDKYGMLSGNFNFNTIAEWDNWQEEDFPVVIAGKNGKTICSDDHQRLYRLGSRHEMELLDEGLLSMDASGIGCGESYFPTGEISDMSTYGRGTLVFSDKKGGYYEISSKQKYCGLKYLRIYRSLKNGIPGK